MRGTFEEPPTGLIPWLSKSEGNTYATIFASPFPLQGKPMQAQDVARRICGAVAGEVFAQVKTAAGGARSSAHVVISDIAPAREVLRPFFLLAVLSADPTCRRRPSGISSSKTALLYCPSSPRVCMCIFFYSHQLFQSHLYFYYY